MKNTLLFLCLFFQSLVFGQHTITVKNNANNQPIKGATIIDCNEQKLGQTNHLGQYTFSTKCEVIAVHKDGFYEESVIVESNMEANLYPTDDDVNSIATVVISSKSDPKALAILDKVNDNFKKNSPKSLDSYSYKSYQKISMDLDKDTIDVYDKFVNKRIDSLSQITPKKDFKKNEEKDSLDEIRMMSLLTESQMFMWEKATEFKYAKKHGEKNIILDNRISGLKQPIYEFLTLRTNRILEPREVRKQNRKLYRFFLSDSIDVDGRETYVIRFKQYSKKSKTIRKFNGYIYVDKATYGIKKIYSESKKSNEGVITSEWDLINDKWFPKKEKVKIRFGSISFGNPKKDITNKEDKPKESKNSDDKDSKEKRIKEWKKNSTEFGNYIYLLTDYFDVQSPIDTSAKNFNGYTYEVASTDGSLMDKYRTIPLTEREKLTYPKIDSLGEEFKLERKIGFFTSLTKGKLRMGKIDLLIPEMIKYNAYEGFRFGVSLKTNEKLNKTFSADGYTAYGLKDGAWKYGAGLDVRLSKRKTSIFRIDYRDDVEAAGRFPENFWNPPMKISNAGITLNNAKYFGFKGYSVGYTVDFLNSISMNFNFKDHQEDALFDYSYKNLGSSFKNKAFRASLKYAPFNTNIMTPAGKYTTSTKYPEFYLDVEKGLISSGGELDYTRANFLIINRIKSKIGVTGVRLFGGKVWGDAPIWHMFTMNGLSDNRPTLNFNLTSYLGFATMEAGKYYNDEFVGTYLSHKIPWYFTTFGEKISNFNIVYRAAIGDMKNVGSHHFNFQKMDHLYQEAGLEWSNVLSTSINLGFFYRIGHYGTKNFKENFAIQFKILALAF